MSKPEIIILRESLAESVVKDIVSVGALTGAIAVGVWIGSGALQWIAGFMWCFLVCAASIRYTLGKPRFTVADARKQLDELEARA